MSEQVRHTLTPWESRPNDEHRWEEDFRDACVVYNVKGETGVAIIGARGGPIQTPEINSANAAFILRAANSHDDLLAACKRALCVLKAQGESVRPGNVLGALDAAISKAEGRAL